MTLAGRGSVNRSLLMIILGMLAFSTGVIGTASAAPSINGWTVDGISISGKLYADSIAVAAFFSIRDSSGAGAFSGTVGGIPTTGLFLLSVSNPGDATILGCNASQILSASGSISSGRFVGEHVFVAVCTDTAQELNWSLRVYHAAPSDPLYSATGVGEITASKLLLKAGFVAAGVTSGSGSAGPGTIYTAEADAVAKDGSLVGGGAFVGTISDVGQGNVWVINGASVQPGCTFTTSGVTASFGSFPNQSISSSYTLVTCPPASSGTQTTRFVYVVGGDANPIYKGTGSADSSFLLPHVFET